MIVSFKDVELEPRFDGTSWTEIRIYESSFNIGPWTLIDTQAIDSSPDPSDPDPVNITTDSATLDPGIGWYKLQLRDSSAVSRDYEPTFNPATVEILASLEDVNAHLDGKVIEATADNTRLVQISVARVVRGYMRRLFDQTTVMSWGTPENTPDTLREIASMLIASRVYFNEASRQSLEVSDDNFAQRMYDEAMKMLEQVVSGDLPIDDESPAASSDLTVDDFWPVDDTNRAFSMDMEL